jgi:hypothetical protein
MADRVVAEARRLYHDRADDHAIEMSARRVVAEFSSGQVRITTFVPLLALRRIKEILTGPGEPVTWIGNPEPSS